MTVFLRSLIALSFVFAFTPLASATPGKALCPDTQEDGIAKSVYALGSSTLGSVLGPMLKNTMKSYDLTFAQWGKASSGLARPDFHDWIKLSPGLMRRHKPDIVVVSIGTNDYQAINYKKGWIAQDDPRWEEMYGERVEKMLEILGGPEKERLIVWQGPYAFAGKNAEARAPIVNRIMKERIEAYKASGGKVVFDDAYARTSKDEKPLAKALIPGKDSPQNIRQGDNIHLTFDGVRYLLEAPIMEAMKDCLPEKKEAP